MNGNNPLPSAAPDPLAGHHPLAGHQDLPQYYVEVETILCALQMIQMSCIELALLQTMLKHMSIETMLKKKVKKSRKNWENIFDRICIQTPRSKIKIKNRNNSTKISQSTQSATFQKKDHSKIN